MAAAADVAQLIVALRLDDKGFSGKLNAAAKQLKAMDSGLSQMGRGAGQVAGGIAKIGAVASVAAAGGLAAAVTTAASFEQAFTGVEKTVDGTETQLGELEETLRQMARTMPVSFEELAGIAEAGGALGIARDSIDEFTDVVARLAVSTDLTSDAAATSLGQLANVLHLGEQDLVDFADSLVALGNAGASTESQIVEMAARFGAAGNSAGLSKEEILALSSAVASMGIEVEAGGSSLSRLFNNTTTNIGVANSKAEAFAEALGLTFNQFKKAWDDDALGTFEALLDHLNELDQFEAASLLKDIGITNTRDINAIMLMAQNTEFLGEQLKIAETATGALNKESDKFFATTIGQWGILKNNVRDATATIGAELLPVVNEAMAEFVGWLQQADTQQGLKTFARDLADGVRGLAGELKGTDWSGIVGGLKLAAEVAKGAFDAFRALPEPIQQLAIAALVANKVSGGAIGQIAAGLGNLVLGSLKTITAGNVTVIGANVTGGGPGVPGGAGGAGLLAKLLGIGSAVAGGVIIGKEVGQALNDPIITPAKTREQSAITAVLDSGDAARIGDAIGAIDDQLNSSDLGKQTALIASRIPYIGDALGNVAPELERQREDLKAELQRIWETEERGAASLRDAIPWHQRNVEEIHNLNMSEANRHAVAQAARNSQISKQAEALAAVRGQSSLLQQIRDRNQNITINNTIPIAVQVGVGEVAYKVNSFQQTVLGGHNPTIL